MKAQPHPDQTERLAALYTYEVLDTDREKDFDDIVQLASAICETPISVINLIDAKRQWFKAETGLGIRETPIATSICAHAILENDFVEIPDTLQDVRMVDNPLCQGNPGLRFYAGAILRTNEGMPLGTLCVLDYEPRTLTPLQRDAIRVLARQVMVQLELRKALSHAELMRREVDHRVKNSLQTLTSIARIQLRGIQSDEATSAMAAMINRIDAVSTLHERLHKTDLGANLDLGSYVSAIGRHLSEYSPPGVSLIVEPTSILVSPKQAVSVGTLMNELVANTFKHAFPNEQSGTVKISLSVTETGAIRVVCADNGAGLRPDATGRTGGLGMKIAEVACMELRCDLVIEDGAPGVIASFEFQPELRVLPESE